MGAQLRAALSTVLSVAFGPVAAALRFAPRGRASYSREDEAYGPERWCCAVDPDGDHPLHVVDTPGAGFLRSARTGENP